MLNLFQHKEVAKKLLQKDKKVYNITLIKKVFSLENTSNALICHAELVSASRETLNQVQGDIFILLCEPKARECFISRTKGNLKE